MKIKIEIDDKSIEKIVGMFKDAVVSSVNMETQPEPVNEAPAEVENHEPEELQEEVRHYTFAEVRTILTDKSREGYTDQVKALVKKYSEKGTLSDVKEENYSNLVLEAQFACRPPFTRDEVAQRIEELKAEGYSNELPGLLEHHYAKSAEDLKEDYFAAFMCDAWRLDHAGY